MRKALMQWGKVLAVMVAVTGILLLVLSYIFFKFNLSEMGIAVGIVMIYLITNFVGGFIIGKIKEKNKYKWGALVGIIFFVSLTIVSMMITGQLYNSGIRALWAMMACVGGGLLGGMSA